MLSEVEARRRILEWTPAPSTSPSSLSESLGRLAAEDLYASVPIPGFDNSQVDGYALRSSEASPGATLLLQAEQPAGKSRDLVLQPGHYIRIFTGAPIPAEADAVVMQEDVELSKDGQQITLKEASEAGEFIRLQGADLCAGQKILSRGQPIHAALLGMLASQGIDTVPTYKPVSCSVLSTGDELVPPGHPLGPGLLYESNGAMLQALVQTWGGHCALPLHAQDAPDHLRSQLRQALDGVDICVIAGGVSVGDHDHVKPCLEALGVEGGFWKVRIKPGKPLYFGRLDQTLVFGLPGNPVSAFITFLLFVLPALRSLQGSPQQAERPPLQTRKGQLTAAVPNRGDRPHYVRGLWDPVEHQFRPTGLQQSHALFSLSQSDSLVRIEAGEELKEGTEATIYMMAPSAC